MLSKNTKITLIQVNKEKETNILMLKITAYQCPNCNDLVYSRTRHDMRYCSCKEIFVDGGFDYARVGFNKIEPTNHEIFIDADKKSLYDDWNKQLNRLGLIRAEEIQS